MKSLTQKSSPQFFGAAMRVVTLALFLAVFGASAMFGSLAYVANAGDNTVFVVNTATNTVTAADDQVPFTVTGTGAITGTTQLPGGLTQINFSTSGTATHLGNFTGPLTRIQDHQGNFGSTAVIVSANGNDSVFLTVNGHFTSPNGKCAVVTSTGTYTVTGGTGAFANATGSGTITTQIDKCVGTATGTYTGTISRPNSH